MNFLEILVQHPILAFLSFCIICQSVVNIVQAICK